MRNISIVAALFIFGCSSSEEQPKTTDDSAPTATATAEATGTADMANPPATSEPVATAKVSAEPTAPPVDPGPALVYEGLKVTLTEKGAKKVEIAKDGTVNIDGKPIMKFVNNGVQDASSNKVIFEVAKDGSVVGLEVKKKVAFNDKNELVFAEGGAMSVGKDGSFKAEKDKKAETFPVKFSGVNDKNRRAALMLGMMFLTMQSSGPSSGPTATSASAVPATSAKPPKK